MNSKALVAAEDCMELIRAMSAVQRALAARLSPLLDEQYGIDLRLFILLKHIHGGVAHPTQLACNAWESPSQISRQIDKLEALGFIERTLDKEDSRRIRLVLTGQAEKMFTQIEQSCADLLSPLLSDLEENERTSLIRGLGHLGAALQPG